jgi:DNA modification methylase
MKINTIIHGDALTELKKFDDECIDMCITSPPYWGLRDYGKSTKTIWDGVKNCKHEWNSYQKNVTSGKGHHWQQAENGPGLQRGIHQTRFKGNTQKAQGDSAITVNAFCEKCGAWYGQLGLEPTFELYIKHLCDIFDEVKRVLKKTGTCWVNIGDTYGGSWGNYGARTGQQRTQNVVKFNRRGVTPKDYIPGSSAPNILAKSLCDIPYRFSIEMVNRGWIKRNTIIWHKSNCMPASAKDRFTVDFEYLFFFVKSKKYWFEQQFDSYKDNPLNRWGGGIQKSRTEKKTVYEKTMRLGKTSKLVEGPVRPNPHGRNKRCVWIDNDKYEIIVNKINGENIFKAGNIPYAEIIKCFGHWFNGEQQPKGTTWKIPTRSFAGAHFAVFPEVLIETPIRAGCPQYICSKCGVPREKIYESKGYPDPENNIDDQGRRKASGAIATDTGRRKALSGAKHRKFKEENPDKFVGYTDCGCNAGFRPGVLLDPFIGAGTSGVTARKLGRDFIGIELQEEYIPMANKRIRAVKVKNVTK